MKYISSAVSVPQEMAQQASVLSAQGKTPLLFAKNDEILGMIAVADVIKDDSAEAIRQLKNMGIEVVMLTGDNEQTAKAIGEQAGVDRVIAGVLPDGKEAVIRSLQERGRTVMVGDGINDAPALTRADTGIAIGAGTDVAIDSADIVLMNSKLSDVSAAVRLSRSVLTNIHENLFWAFFYNLICIPLAAGLLKYQMNPMVGAAAMSLSSFTVCMNALRLNLTKIHDPSHDRPIRHKKTEAVNDERTIRVKGMMCEHCKNRVEKAVCSVAGVQSAKADHTTGTVILRYDRPVNDEDLKKAIEEQDYEMITEGEEKEMKMTVKIEGMMCEHCEASVKKALEKLDGVKEAKADHVKGICEIITEGEVDEAKIKEAIEDRDYKYIGIQA